VVRGADCFWVVFAFIVISLHIGVVVNPGSTGGRAVEAQHYTQKQPTCLGPLQY
jgi:hypothetical protein